MKKYILGAIFLCVIVLPAFGDLTLTQADLDTLQLMMNNTVEKAILESEARMKEHIDIRFKAVDKQFEAVDKQFEAVDKRIDSIDKRIDSVEKRITHVTYITIGLIALIIVAVGIPQIISVAQGAKNRELEKKIEELTQKVETLEQQRIVQP